MPYIYGFCEKEMDILVTRPQIQAHRTVAQIEKGLARVFVLPLTESKPLNFTIPKHSSFEALLATSANAFHIKQEILASLYSLPLFCVGEKTALAAQSAGFSSIAAIKAQAHELVSYLKYHPAQNFLYFAGKTRRPTLEQELRAQGKAITVLETYQQRPLYPTPSAMNGLPLRFDYALFYSAMAAQAAMAVNAFFDAETRFLCLSSRIACALPQKYQPQALIAHAPNEASLLELIRSNHS